MQMTLTVNVENHEYQRTGELNNPKDKYAMVEAWLAEIEAEFGPIGPVYEVIVRDEL